MKKTLLVLLCLITLSGWAQKSQVESAALYFNNAEMEDAKKAIDAAFEHPDTKDNVKMLYYRAAIYDTIATSKDEKVRKLDIDAAEKWALAAKRCLELDKKEIYKEQIEYNIVNAAFACNSAAYEASQRSDYKKIQSYYQLVIDLLPYDKNGDMKTNNLTEKSIVFNQFYFANKEKIKEDQKKYLKRLIELDYQDHLIYAYLTNIYLEEGDTNTAISYLEKGRTLFPEKKDLIGQEINIYIAQNKLDILMQKVELANEQKPEDPDLIYTRGNLYDNAATGFAKEIKKYKEEATSINKKAKIEKNVATKKQLEAQAKDLSTKVMELNKKAAQYQSKAEADYFKAIELNPDMIDAYYNLGALTNNKTTAIAEKINAIDAKTQTEYDKKFNAFKKVQDSIFSVAIAQFEKVIEIAEVKSEKTPEDKAIKYAYLKDAYYSLQLIYAGMKNESKSNEYRAKKEEIIINSKKKG
ncbi:MAG: tetratricopeptide repeat protein [Bacteroidia bacterium]